MKDLKPIIDSIISEIIEIRQHIHANPEIGLKEVQTASLICETLSKISNITVIPKVGKTGVIGILGAGKTGPCVALRADMDALPIQEENDLPYASRNDGCMHACGHDGHVASLIGTARVLSTIADELEGPVKFIFQPAEELGVGALLMKEDGALEKPKVDAIFGFHCSRNLKMGQVGVKSGAFMAGSNTFTITINGKGCHAAYPQNGIDPILMSAHIITALQSIVSRNISPNEKAVVSICKVEAGTAANIIPEKVVLTGTMRALNTALLDKIVEQVKTIIKSIAESFGGTATLELFNGFPVLINSEKTTDYFATIARKTVGEENLVDDYQSVMGSEDFAYFSQTVPGTYWNQGYHSLDEKNRV
ncbi:MAG: amidohydrolase [Deltaproteobacteria bacterium]|nr:amidohydrolase [Deltaproteobacteria bacterium]